MDKKSFLLITLIHIFIITHLEAKSENVFEKDAIHKSIMKVAKWQLCHPQYDLREWTNGAFYAGLSAAYKCTKSPEILDSLMAMGNRNQWKPGSRIENADDYAICQTYIDLYRIKGDRKMIEPLIKHLNEYMNTPHIARGIEPISWWWADALFMAPPAIVKLGVTLKNKQYLAFSDKHFKECYALIYDKEECLFARDLRFKDVRKEANGKKVFWGRGNGWVMAGLAMIIDELPKSNKQRAFYVKLFVEMSAKIASIQQPDGLWRASLLDPEAYNGGESSGSGFYTYALAWGINRGVLDKSKYLGIVKKGWVALNALVTPEGKVGWTQPIGDNPRKNFSAESSEVYGAGAYLFAASEVVKLKY